MNCTRIKLDAGTTVVFIRDGWLIVEVADVDALREQLNGADGTRLLSVAEVSERTGFTCGACHRTLQSVPPWVDSKCTTRAGLFKRV
jgi:hypothetical protein